MVHDSDPCTRMPGLSRHVPHHGWKNSGRLAPSRLFLLVMVTLTGVQDGVALGLCDRTAHKYPGLLVQCIQHRGGRQVGGGEHVVQVVPVAAAKDDGYQLPLHRPLFLQTLPPLIPLPSKHWVPISSLKPMLGMNHDPTTAFTPTPDMNYWSNSPSLL